MNTAEYKYKRESAKRLFLNGERDVATLARIFEVATKTVRRWISKGQWVEEYNEIQDLEEQIELAIKRALIHALKGYAMNPQNTALQSLVSLLKQYRNASDPSREFFEYLKHFLDWLVDFYFEKNDMQTAKAIQREILGEKGIVEYFRKRAG